MCVCVARVCVSVLGGEREREERGKDKEMSQEGRESGTETECIGDTQHRTAGTRQPPLGKKMEKDSRWRMARVRRGAEAR